MVFLKLETIQKYQVTWLPTLKNSCQVLFFYIGVKNNTWLCGWTLEQNWGGWH